MLPFRFGVPLGLTRRSVFTAACLACMAGATLLSAQTQSSVSPSTIVAYMYVSQASSAGSYNQIAGYSLTAGGTLATVPGSPFRGNVASMAVNGQYLFGSKLDGVYVVSYRILSNGALDWVYSKNIQQYNSSGCAYPGSLGVDRSGATLYVQQTVGDLCDSTRYLSFTIDPTRGWPFYLGKSADTFLYNDPLAFAKNDRYAYGTRCVNYQGSPLDTFTGYIRHSSGLLDTGGQTATTPATSDPGHFYCRSYTAADSYSHIAMTMTDTDFNDPYNSPPAQIGTYTVDSSGNLTTTSTAANMPSVAVGYVTGLAISHNSKLLAVSGNGGLQVFHYNGANPATYFTGLLTSDSIDQIGWDHDGHLFALSRAAGKLYIFQLTSTTVTPLPGSPFAVSSPSNLVVQPLT